MQWKPLGTPVVQGLEVFWKLPLFGQGGRLWFKLPKVEIAQRISVGWGDNDDTPPTRFHLSERSLEAYGQIIDFLLPPFLENPFLGIRFAESLIPITILYQWSPMSVIVPQKSELPIVAAADFKAPMDVGYSRFLFERTGETFTRYSDTEWKGELVYTSDSFAPTVDSAPATRIADPGLAPSITFHPTDHQGWLSLAQIQNVDDVPQTVFILATSAAGEHYNASVTIAANDSQSIAVNLKRSDYDSLVVKVCCENPAGLALNTYTTYLLEIAPAN